MSFASTLCSSPPREPLSLTASRLRVAPLLWGRRWLHSPGSGAFASSQLGRRRRLVASAAAARDRARARARAPGNCAIKMSNDTGRLLRVARKRRVAREEASGFCSSRRSEHKSSLALLFLFLLRELAQSLLGLDSVYMNTEARERNTFTGRRATTQLDVSHLIVRLSLESRPPQLGATEASSGAGAGNKQAARGTRAPINVRRPRQYVAR